MTTYPKSFEESSLSFLADLDKVDHHQKSDKKPEENDVDKPSMTPQSVSNIENLEFISQVFQQIEEETVEIAEMIFDYLIDATDAQIMTGTIPAHKNKRINAYIRMLNRLFKFSRANSDGGFRLISRNTIQALDKKTYTISMCNDGGTSLDILCDVVNSENAARTPNNRVKVVVVKQLAPQSKGMEIET